MLKEKRELIANDYNNSGLSVAQIAEKHGICVRTVYNSIQAKNRRNRARPNRRALRLTKAEAEVILLCIMEAESVLSNNYRETLHAIENRVLIIADELTQLH